MFSKKLAVLGLVVAVGAAIAAAPAPVNQRSRIIDEMSECVVCMEHLKPLTKHWQDELVRLVGTQGAPLEYAKKSFGQTSEAYGRVEHRFYELCDQLNELERRK